MDIVVTLPPSLIDGIKTQIIGELKVGDLFAPAKPLLTADDYREIASCMDVSDLAAEFDASDIADRMDVSEVASEVAQNISDRDIAENVDMDEIARIVSDNIDAADVAQHLDNAGIDWSECIDHDKIAASIVRSFKQDPELRDAFMVSLCRVITDHLARA